MGSGSVCSPTSRLPTSEDDHGLTAPARSLKRHLLRPEEWLPLEATAKGLRTPWQTVYWWFGRWRTDGTFERLNDALRRRLRSRLGRDPLPSAAIADSQTTKTTGVGGEQRGYDGNKKVRGILSGTSLGGHRGLGPQGQGARPGRTETSTGVGAYRALAPEASVVGCGLRGQGQKVGRGGDGLERGGSAQAKTARTRGSSEAVGRGVGQGGSKGRLAKADAAARLYGSTPQVVSGKDLLVALSEQEDEQGLREAVRQRGSVRLRGNDTSHGEEIGPCLRISKQFLRNRNTIRLVEAPLTAKR